MTSTICKHDEFCGGCSYRDIPYAEQLKNKEDEIRKLFQLKNLQPEEFLPIQASPRTEAYRNKMEYTFGDEVKGGEMNLGLHRKGRFMSVLTTDDCKIVDPDFNKILSAVLSFCREKEYPHYNKKSHKGFLRNLILRKGIRTREILVNLVVSSQGVLDKESFLNVLNGLSLDNTLVGVLVTVSDSLSDAVKPESVELLQGRDYYMEEILGLKFKVGPFSFFQASVEAAENLYRSALSLIPDIDGKTVFDLYCGTGTITQAMALKAKLAVGVELNEEAVAAAKINSELNNLDNCKFIAGDVLKVLDDLTEKPEVIVVDPPRSGIHPKAMGKILSYNVDQIVYVSCNPKTLVENLESATYAGYKIKSVQGFDNFPHTKHIECIAFLSK
ncbi:MAG: 23S rRNA (uracil(1939)-C(5))-methyltransferase RlmD [Firmicutes bacterium]|nr:23S rRNA (uracil(1939)-C(5))-methyltransferase RlmD [Clostridiales bacterium]MBQ9931618.1 23S rRNA (uracil(1939)-C(5))-methyltransferase RlmD [Bacillota bacterium]